MSFCPIYFAPQKSNAFMSLITINVLAASTMYWNCYKYYIEEKGNKNPIIT